MTILGLGIEKEEALFFWPVNSLEDAVVKMKREAAQ